MKNSINHEHIFEMIPDYVLDLSTDRQRQHVIQHVTKCRQCKLALEAERQLLSTVRVSISSATEPHPQRLVELMPVPPRVRYFRQLATTWPTQLAVVSLLIILIVGAINLNFSGTGTIWQNGGAGAMSTSVITSTAAVTKTPTVTVTTGNIRKADIGYTAVPHVIQNGSSDVDPFITPAPIAPGLN
jgi:hypothetical protein